MTPELIKRLLRLERAFMPYAQRQRRKAYLTQTGAEPAPSSVARFAHYTSATAAMSIISEKRIWMRNTNCMSDVSEIQHGFTILKEFFSGNNIDKTRFFDALDNCSRGVATEAVNLFDGWFRDTSLNTYISSISEHMPSEDSHGRLSMWRAFGGNTARVAFVLKVPYQSGISEVLPIMFSPVGYLSTEGVHGVLREVIENINNERAFLQSIERPHLVGMVFTMLLAAVTCLKHEGFEEEREWRVIYSPKRQPSPLMKSVITEISGVPQPVYLLPLDGSISPALADIDFATMFDRLIIGPSPYPWPMYESFSEALSKAGVENAGERVFISGIPIRS